MQKILKIKDKVLALNSSTIPFTGSGKILGISGGLVEAEIPFASVGDICRITGGRTPILGRVVSFNQRRTLVAPFSHTNGIGPQNRIATSLAGAEINIPQNPMGMILDGLGKPLKNINHQQSVKRPLNTEPPDPLSRKTITKPFITGVAAIDSLCTLGRGQRVGLMAAPGVGKSTLLGMIARNAKVDVSVVALVGERGREVNEFIEDILGKDGLSKSVLVVTTSDESPIRRSLAASTATSIAEMYRAQGKNVLLLVDSITRTARAIRDLSLTAGELPVRQGYTPSVYNELPKLFERAGNDDIGSITAIYTVLTSGEDEEDPLAEEVKSLLDGHISLSRDVAASGVRPAIDVPASISRVMSRVISSAHQFDSDFIRRILSRLIKDKDIVTFGGTPDEELQAALEMESELKAFLNQRPHENREFDKTLPRLGELSAKIRSKICT